MRHRVRLVVCLLALGPGPAAFASGLVVPRDAWAERNQPLANRSIDVRVMVSNHIARVTTTFVFANPQTSAFEGTFRTKLRPGAAVLGFAYWFRGLRVPGRVLERGEAHRIYQRITQGLNRDPALFERRGDWYEATVFPIEPGTDLRLELDSAWLLPLEGGDLVFDYPLLARFAAQPIEDLEIEATFERCNGITNLRGNLPGLTIERHANAWTARYHQRHVQPDRNLVLRAALQRRLPYAFVERGPEALAYTHILVMATRSWSSVALCTDAGPVVQVAPALPRRLRAGERLAVWARVPPTARTLFVATGGRTIRISLDPDPPPAHGRGLISRLWARAVIAKLTGDDPRHPRQGSREAVVQLSKAFSVDSPFTAFLAVPDSEWSAYERSLEEEQRLLRDEVAWRVSQLRLAKVVPAWLVPSDPQIKVKAPRDAVSVTAVLPDGEVIPLVWDPAQAIWRGRFEIPRGTPEGDYAVTVVVLLADGRRTELTARYQVDLTPPTATADALAARPGARVTVQVDAGDEVAKVVVVAAWGERVEARRDPVSHRFEAALTVPPTTPPGPHAVQISAYDRAHNRTAIETAVEVQP